jgi:predicted RecB family nuclease
MRVRSDRLTSSPTDLANFLACRHKTELDLLAARGRIARPTWEDPLVDVLRERGLEHERAYIDGLRASGLRVVDLSRNDDERLDDAAAGALTLAAMREGADVIVQAPIVGDGWFGYADVLRKVEGASDLGGWHYEAEDTKLSRETRGGTILQLCVY